MGSGELIASEIEVGNWRVFQSRGWTFFVSEDQPPNDLLLRLRDSLSHKAGPRFEILPYIYQRTISHKPKPGLS